MFEGTHIRDQKTPKRGEGRKLFFDEVVLSETL